MLDMLPPLMYKSFIDDMLVILEFFNLFSVKFSISFVSFSLGKISFTNFLYAEYDPIVKLSFSRGVLFSNVIISQLPPPRSMKSPLFTSNYSLNELKLKLASCSPVNRLIVNPVLFFIVSIILAELSMFLKLAVA